MSDEGKADAALLADALDAFLGEETHVGDYAAQGPLLRSLWALRWGLRGVAGDGASARRWCWLKPIVRMHALDLLDEAKPVTRDADGVVLLWPLVASRRGLVIAALDSLGDLSPTFTRSKL